MRNIQQLLQNINVTPVCAGVDPDLSKILQYEEFRGRKNSEDAIYDYLQTYIESVGPHVSSFKVQKAFFDLYPGGHNLLKQIVANIHASYVNVPVILDCKIGDIDNTMSAYIENIFGHLDCDGVVVNPYMGDDVLKEISMHKDKIIAVLCKTSNKGGSIIQDKKFEDGNPLWMHVLDLSMNEWNSNDNIVPILSSVEDKNLLVAARKIIPEQTPILFAGVGAQGREQSDIQYLRNKSNGGVFVNSSRGLMYPKIEANSTLGESVTGAVTILKKNLETEALSQVNNVDNGCFLILAGVSGVGKTTIINELKKIDSRFTYVSPEITRDLRDGERDKVHVSEQELKQKETEDKYLVVNHINGVYYATPKDTITKNFRNNMFSVLDFPIDKTEVISEFVRNKVFVAYVSPPSLRDLKTRLSYDGRDKQGLRFSSAATELSKYHNRDYDKKIDLHIVSEDGKAAEIAQTIYLAFTKKFNQICHLS